MNDLVAWQEGAPWFTDDVDQKGVAYFQNQGFEVVHASHLTPAIKVPHPNLGSDVNPTELYVQACTVQCGEVFSSPGTDCARSV